jgi:hypothetical protein
MKKEMRADSRFRRDLTMIFLGGTVLVLGTIAYLAVQAKRSVSEQYIYNATSRAVEDFQVIQHSIEESLGMVCDFGRSGLLSLDKPEMLKEQLMPFFRKEPMLSGISVADARGRSYFILPDGTVRMPKDAEAQGFDPKTRPWFLPALSAHEVFWTEQYLFHTLKKIGITASSSFLSPKTGEKVVVAFDILLPDFYRHLKKMAPSPNSRVFVFRKDELLFLPENEEGLGEGFVPIESQTNSLISRAYSFWERSGGSGKEIFSFVNRGKVWWCGFQSLDARHRVWVGVAVPESDILGDVSRRWQLLVGLGLGIILLAGIGFFWLIRRYGQGLDRDDSLDRPYSEADIRAMIAKGENRYLEFKSTMRMNLHTKKPGKEIELAWLKGVAACLNTDGGTLLLGVSDAGELIGLEADVFENEDKCRLHFKNLIATHIGAEMSKYIRFQLIRIEGKTIGVIHCSRAAEPVFLRNGNKEAFYIRNGPSSDELPVSKALKYIRDRQGEL